VQELQYFLREHDVEFHTEPPQGQLDAARQSAAAKKKAAKGAQLCACNPKSIIRSVYLGTVTVKSILIPTLVVVLSFSSLILVYKL